MISQSQERAVLDAVQEAMYIGGEWRDAADGHRMAVEDPATGDVLLEIPDGSSTDAALALEQAVAAQDSWGQVAPRERGEILRRAFDKMMDKVDDLALLMTLEMGKPIAESRAEVTYAAEFFRWFSEESVRIDGRYAVAPNGGNRLITLKQPVGPSLLITPWNFPLAMGTRKVGPAIAAGCTVVLKPAPQAPLSSLAMAQILHECALPPGVLNVVTTSDADATISPLIGSGKVRKLSFTGSTAVGRYLLGLASGQVLRVSMELGGNAPFLVFPDADLDEAVNGAITAKMRNMGEACTAANRFLIHKSIAYEFSSLMADRLGKLKLGRGTEDGVDVGPLIDKRGRAKVERLVEDAVSRGAEVQVGGRALPGGGYFYEPTVLTGITSETRLLHEEIFGPVVPITTFKDEAEAINLANKSNYGLVSYLYTKDIHRAFHLSEALESGMVGLNQGMVSNPAAPFGGIKHSGLGREGGSEGINEYLETKYINMNL